MLLGPKTSSWPLTSTVSPCVMLMSPVTAAHPMSMPSMLSASLNLRSFSPWKAVSMVSSSFTSGILEVALDINCCWGLLVVVRCIFWSEVYTILYTGNRCRDVFGTD